MMRNNFSIFVINIAIIISLSTVTATSRNKDPVPGPVKKSVFDKDLVVEFPSASQVIKHHASYYEDTSLANFNGTVLGYVTPWNNHGYDTAQWFANKFTHISPVWLQIRRTGKLIYEFGGTHDIDQNWIKKVKDAGAKRKVKILPRVFFDNWNIKSMTALIGNQAEIDAFIETVIGFCKDRKFDGFVLEMWSQFAPHVHQWQLTQFIVKLGDVMQSAKLDLILVVPPNRGEPEDSQLFTDTDFENLYDHVTAFSLMTYDFSSLQKPGPNSPIDWVRSCVESLTMESHQRKKILVGLNFYGYDYTPRGGQAIVAHEYLKILKHLKGKMSYSREFQEHHFEVKNEDGRHWVFFPTLLSIKTRIDLISELETGISIWELGQGLDYFYDLL